MRMTSTLLFATTICVFSRNVAHKPIERWKLLRALICSVEPAWVYLKSINILSAIFCWHLQRFSMEVIKIIPDCCLPHSFWFQRLYCRNVCSGANMTEYAWPTFERCNGLLSLQHMLSARSACLYLLSCFVILLSGKVIVKG